jgi:acyl-CoA reductase-like NAD-dependent aldehyde dehydrogenase
MADEYRMLIAGERVGSEGGATFEATSPSTGEVTGTLPEGTRDDVRRAVASGRVGGRFSIERLTELKTIVVHLG